MNIIERIVAKLFPDPAEQFGAGQIDPAGSASNQVARAPDLVDKKGGLTEAGKAHVRSLIKAKEQDIRRKADIKMAELQAQDEAHMQDIRNGWKPGVTISDYPVGTFVGYGKVEKPARYIVDIKITDNGGEPYLLRDYRRDYTLIEEIGAERDRGEFDYTTVAAVEQPGQITIFMAAGHKDIITENRHKLPFVAEALVAAWKQAKG